MTHIQTLFLQAVSAALKNEYVAWDRDLTPGEWDDLFRLALDHRMLPMVYQAVSRCPAMARADRSRMVRYRVQAMQMVALQIRKTEAFSQVLTCLRQEGVHPLVVKGIVCRQLFPEPDFRLSSDEDLLIAPEEFTRCQEVLARLGYETPDPEDPAYELTYRNSRSPLNLELHRSLFPQQGPTDLNRFFRNVHRRSVLIRDIPTPDPTDHMLFLLCHAYKHFLHSGFGLRQVCDLVLYAHDQGSSIDWPYLLACCRQERAEQFAAGLFRIGWKHLGFLPEEACYPLCWQAIYVDETPLLEDILQAGVYGSADPDRVHSSNLTLQAVANRDGSAPAAPLLETVFPSRQVMEKKYPYVKDRPMLLPVAWTERILNYGRSSAQTSGVLKTGAQRMDLLRRYGIID